MKRTRTVPSLFLRYNLGKMTKHQRLLSVNALITWKVRLLFLHFNQSKFVSFVIFRHLSFETNDVCNGFGRNQAEAHANDSTV